MKDKTPPLVDKCIPTAAELNEMGVSCWTCPHYTAYDMPKIEPMGRCDWHQSVWYRDDFCNDHPKLRGDQ